MAETTFKAESKRRILVVEDEFINSEILRLVLEDTYEVLTAERGADGLGIAAADADRLSLVLLDLNLPDMHGLDVLRALKADDDTSRIPVIVMTAERESEVESLNLGAIDFIPKPYPVPEVILARVRRTIELSEDRDIISHTERDALTGLYSKEYFFRYAEQFDAFNPDTATDAIVVDINHFRLINERYGRAFGDAVLRRVGEALVSQVAEAGGMVGRGEAESFFVYCPHRSGYETLVERASVELSGKSRVRLRMGVYPKVDRTLGMEERFDRAKAAADNVRGNLGVQVGMYDESLREAELFAEQLVEDFPSAIAEGQFILEYQPKFDIRPTTYLMQSAEALIRWRHPRLGLISPGTFIPLFEENGLIPELDRFVWNEAARQIAEWKTRHETVVPISVNVSRIDMYDPELPNVLQNILEANGVSQADMVLEITESAYVKNSAQIVRSVTGLRECGFRIEMDDFGSGYSSLNMISELPVDALKLDMQFVRNAFKNRKDTRLLEIMVQLGKMLGVPTIAEGAETAEQVFTLRNMGCDLVQGYYFSRPLPADRFEEFMAEQEVIRSEYETRQALAFEAEDANGGAEGSAHDLYTINAMHDPLTGLYNNSAFNVLFHNKDKEHIGVLLLSVDGYGSLKFEHGQAAADTVVKRVASVLRDNFRNADDVCRLQEDEFVVVMTRMQSAQTDLVFDKVQRINGLLQQVDTSAGDLPVTLTVGVAFSDREAPGPDIFADADGALAKAKAGGSAGFAVY